jgi:hypothetical protein
VWRRYAALRGMLTMRRLHLYRLALTWLACLATSSALLWSCADGEVVACEPEGACDCREGEDRPTACTCQGGSTCRIDADHIEFDCEGNAGCELACGNDCLITCPGTTRCEVHVGDGAEISCPGTATCNVVCAGDCAVQVTGAARATVTCEAEGAECEIRGCPATTDCGGGVFACKTACP